MIAHSRRKYAFGICVMLFFLATNGSFNDRSFAQECSKDPMPPELACTHVRPLGEMNRCACFVCFTANGSRGPTVCTTDQALKQRLLDKPRR